MIQRLPPRSGSDLRLAYLVSQYPAVNHTFIMREVRGLRNAGVDVNVISISAADRSEDLMTADERDEFKQTFYVKRAGIFSVLYAHASTVLTTPRSYFGGLWLALKLGKLDPVRTMYRVLYFTEAVVAGSWMLKHDILHVHIHFSSTVGLLLKRVFPISISITIHGPDEFTDPVGFHLAEKVASALFISAISKYARSQLMRVADAEHWSRIEVVPLGIDPTVFTANAHRDAPQPFEVICVGRLAPVKAHGVLIAAVERLIREGRNVRLRIVGGGPSRVSLQRDVQRRHLEDHVVLEGPLHHDRVLELYRSADLFALPSFAEGVPVVLMEAMAMELPCVATRIMGVPELIRDGIDGVLIDPADEIELADAIGHLMDDPTLRCRLGKSGRAHVLEKYDLRRNVVQLADVLHRRLRNDSLPSDLT